MEAIVASDGNAKSASGYAHQAGRGRKDAAADEQWRVDCLDSPSSPVHLQPGDHGANPAERLTHGYGDDAPFVKT
jgi:hypothetical protein